MALFSLGSAWAFSAVLIAGLASGGEPESIRLLVLPTAGSGSEFAERVRGQSSDLRVVIVEAPVQWNPAESATAASLGETVEADVVVWLDARAEGRTALNVLRRGQLTRRELVMSDGSDSATFEAAALLVREALGLFASEPETSESTISAAVVETPVAEASEDGPAVEPLDSKPPEGEPSRREPEPTEHRVHPRPRLLVGVAWELAGDGASPRGRHAPRLRLGVHGRNWEAAGFVAASFPTDPGASVPVRLGRTMAGMDGAVAFGSGHWRSALGGRAGLATYRRVTEPSAFVEAEAPRTTATACAGVFAQFRRHWRTWQLGLDVGSDLFFFVPEVAIRTVEGPVRIAGPRPVAPWVGIEVQLLP